MSWVSKLGRKIGGALGIGDKKTTTTTTLDPATQRYVDAMRQQAQAGANTIMNGPGGYGSAPGGGGIGGMIGRAVAMGSGGPGGNSWFTGPQTMSIGDQAAAFFNPYLSNVVDATRGEFDFLRGQANMGANQEATRANAFGGSRHGIMAGTRLGEIDRAQGSQIAGLMYNGYQTALTQGTAYAEQQRQLQQQQMMEPIFRAQTAQGMYNLGLGPYGQTTTQTQPGVGLLGTVAGIGMTAYGAGLLGGPQSNPTSFAQPAPWTAPQWNPQYRSPWGY